MARIDKNGVVRGAISNIIFRRLRKIDVVQSKPAKVKHTEGTKKRNTEFGMASTAAALIISNVEPAFIAGDSDVQSRLTARLVECLTASPSKECGERDLNDANLDVLRGFQFNLNSPLSKVFPIRPEVYLNGEGHIVIKLSTANRKKILKYHPFLPKSKSKEMIGIHIETIDLVDPHSISTDFVTHDFSETDTDGLEWTITRTFQPGAIALVTFVILFHSSNVINERNIANNKSFSPAEIIGVLRIPKLFPA